MILALSPHTDDTDLACGGTINRFIKEGKEVMVIAFSDCNNPHIGKEFENAQLALGVMDFGILDFERRMFHRDRQEILDVLLQYKPELVLCPSSTDTHQDHQVIHQEAVRAFKKTNILGYNLPWNNVHGDKANCRIGIDDNIEAKIKALSCYESQHDRKYFSEVYQFGIHTVNAINTPYNLAESFEVINWMI
jgi:LmbE family N-acetylglucosaminyl deacetylase